MANVSQLLTYDTTRYDRRV